jgi:putative tricarboxylic transport membrane protein
MRVADRITGLILVGLGALSAYGGSLLPPVPGQPVGPNVFPVVVGVGLVLCGLMIAFGIGHTFEDEAEADLAAHSDVDHTAALHSPWWKLRALIPPGLLLFYVFGSERLGFIATAAIMVLVLAMTLGARLRLALPLAILAPIGVHLIFAKLLRVALPIGLLPMPW